MKKMGSTDLNVSPIGMGTIQITRLDWGQTASSEEVIPLGAQLVSLFAPRWDAEAGSIDYYYWLFGTRALARIGGEPYARWRPALLAALLPHQREDGSWPAVDAWSVPGTEVHATVVCALALQAAR